FYWYMLVLIKVNKASILKIYPKLLHKAEKFVLRTPEQPLNDYAQVFETKYPQFDKSFIKLTANYEKRLYGGIEKTDERQQDLIVEVAKQLTKIKK
ncbi:MAG: hypothetical protein L0J76_05815, partial [Tetragenococcus halophilus]|nr:hypothetical protein [Tetragenococcus halophilus]